MASRGMKVTFSAPAALPSHVALCIGNSKYASSPLANAAHDAEDVAALCRTLGFATECEKKPPSRCAALAHIRRTVTGAAPIFSWFAASHCQQRPSRPSTRRLQAHARTRQTHRRTLQAPRPRPLVAGLP